MTHWHCPVCVTVFCVLCTYDKGYCFNFPLQNSQLRYKLGQAGDQAELTLIYICGLSPSCATNYLLSTIPHLISTSPAPSFPLQPQLSHLKQFSDRSRHLELDTCTGQWTVDSGQWTLHQGEHMIACSMLHVCRCQSWEIILVLNPENCQLENFELELWHIAICRMSLPKFVQTKNAELFACLYFGQCV